MMKKKDVKKDKNFYFTILTYLKTNYKLSMLSIANKLGKTRQNINYYARHLKELGYIKKKGYGTWEITESGKNLLNRPNKMEFLHVVLDKHKKKQQKSSIGWRKGFGEKFSLINYNKKLEVHAIQVKMPIEKGKIDFTQYGGWEQEGLNNWKPQYLELKQPTKIVMRNNNNKSISVFIHASNIKDPDNIHPLIYQCVAKVFEWFKDKSASLSLLRWKVLNTDIAREDDIAKDKLRKGDRILQKFDKNRRKITEYDPDQQSKAWLDTSPDPSIETNDIDYMYEYLKMPFRIKDIADDSISTSKTMTKIAIILQANTEQMGSLIELGKSLIPKNGIKEETPSKFNTYIG